MRKIFFCLIALGGMMAAVSCTAEDMPANTPSIHADNPDSGPGGGNGSIPPPKP